MLWWVETFHGELISYLPPANADRYAGKDAIILGWENIAAM
jgi:hypothetical protein